MQTPIHIEALSKKSVMLQELPSGDVELVIHEHKRPDAYSIPQDCTTTIATITKDRRCLLANWLAGNNHK